MNEDRANIAQRTLILEAIRSGGNALVRAAHLDILMDCRERGWIVTTDHCRHFATRAGYRAVGMAMEDDGLTPEKASELTPDQLAVRVQADQVHVRGAEAAHVLLFGDEMYAGPKAGDRATAEMIEDVNRVMNERTGWDRWGDGPNAHEKVRPINEEMASTSLQQRSNLSMGEVEVRVQAERAEERKLIANMVRRLDVSELPFPERVAEHIALLIETGA
jgi:hypothetical protein